ncbi:thioesterase [Lysinibacillus sp. BF-4]|nr:thioesterase [Lysinibacillus sp. BF-4]
MNLDLQLLWQQIMQDATTEDKEALQHLLTGIREKQQGVHTRYINASLRMTGEFFEDYSKVCIPNSPVIQNSIQVAHGGVLATLADAAMGGLASRAAPVGKNVVTTNLTMNYIATSKAPILLAKGYFVHRGKKTFVMSAIIEDSTGKRLATASATFFVIQKRTV